MFTFLTPALFWLAPLLAVPLAIAFMSRAQPKTRDFPSLLPVRESLQRAMRKHRLKNWLQLILRTLALLFLLLAAAGPVWRGSSTLQPPGSAVMLMNNGVYASLPEFSAAAPRASGPGTIERDRQESLLAELDSLTGGNAFAEPLIPDAENRESEQPASGNAAQDGLRVVARFGSPLEAFTRLRQRAVDRAGRQGSVHVYASVFDARDLETLARVARPWLESNPSARLIVLDQGDAAARLAAFGPVRATFAKEGMATLYAPTALPEQAPHWSSGNTVRPARMNDSGNGPRAEVLVPLSEQAGTSWIVGTLALSEADSAREKIAIASVAAVFRVPPPAVLCHVGPREAVASLATLGAGGERLRIRALLPGAGGQTDDCNLLYLADPPNADAPLLSRAAAVIRKGGKVILETGPHTDPVLWNRNLLVPLGVGRLTVAKAAQSSPLRARAHNAALAALGIAGERWGEPGTVARCFGFLPSTGTNVLLSAEANGTSPGSEPNPLLAHRRIGGGELLVWTTSLSDPDWSTIGLGPWPALLHQAFLAKAWAAGIEPRTVDTDSQWVVPGDASDEALGNATETGAGFRVFGPDGNRFSRVRAEPGGWIVGPFDQTGVYRVESPEDTGWFAANLAQPAPPPGASDWKAFHELLGGRDGKADRQTLILGPEENWRSLYGGVRLRSVLLGIAALLLFAEGVVSLRLTNLPNVSNPSSPADSRKS